MSRTRATRLQPLGGSTSCLIQCSSQRARYPCYPSFSMERHWHTRGGGAGHAHPAPCDIAGDGLQGWKRLHKRTIPGIHICANHPPEASRARRAADIRWWE